jgi:hypothetical protein
VRRDHVDAGLLQVGIEAIAVVRDRQ